jgi:hypothetical protein
VLGRFLTLLLLVLPGAAPAQEPPYLSGGVGEEERAMMLPYKDDFSLQLLFALRKGNYLAAVDVRISDGEGVELLSARSDGPFFFVQLEPGWYTVTATYGGETQARRLKVPVSAAFYWDER